MGETNAVVHKLLLSHSMKVQKWNIGLDFPESYG